jgi:hypothetical protein
MIPKNDTITAAMTMMTYKGYEAAVEFDEDAGIFHGEEP